MQTTSPFFRNTFTDFSYVFTRALSLIYILFVPSLYILLLSLSLSPSFFFSFLSFFLPFFLRTNGRFLCQQMILFSNQRRFTMPLILQKIMQEAEEMLIVPPALVADILKLSHDQSFLLGICGSLDAYMQKPDSQQPERNQHFLVHWHFPCFSMMADLIIPKDNNFLHTWISPTLCSQSFSKVQKLH